MTHRNARLTVWARGELVRCVADGLSQAEAAKQFNVARATAGKWVRRHREGGLAALEDRSCRPHRSPRSTAAGVVTRICQLRRARNWGPQRIGWALHVPGSTVHAVLRRAGLHRREWLHRTTRQIVRYERAAPGELVHLDVKKVGRIPPGGGKRVMPGFAETGGAGPHRGRGLGFDYLHVAVDDHSRYAYVEALSDERGPTTAGFLERTLAVLADRGVRVERILTDNGKNYTSHAFREVAAAHHLQLKRTRPYRPQTNGKAEAFNKILQAEWAYARPYFSNAQRLEALPRFLRYYNQRRSHGGINGATPASRLPVNNVPGHYT